MLGSRKVKAAQQHCGRKIYLDLGVNWGNTLRLFRDVPQPDLPGHWEIFGFEASPLIQPYAEAFAQWLNGDRARAPVLCFPPSGSPGDLRHFAAAYNCGHYANSKRSSATDAGLQQCIMKSALPHLEQLRADAALNSSLLISSRMAQAERGLWFQGEAASTARPVVQYTLIPAAVTGGWAPPWTEFWMPLNQLIFGGGVEKSVDATWTARARAVERGLCPRAPTTPSGANGAGVGGGCSIPRRTFSRLTSF